MPVLQHHVVECEECELGPQRGRLHTERARGTGRLARSVHRVGVEQLGNRELELPNVKPRKTIGEVLAFLLNGNRGELVIHTYPIHTYFH